MPNQQDIRRIAAAFCPETIQARIPVVFNYDGPGFDSKALENWLNLPNTHFFCDTYAAAGSVAEGFFARENVRCPGSSAGRTKQAFVLLSEKVLANIETALAE